MFNSKVNRSLWLALAAAAVLTAAGCSQTATEEASNTAKEAKTAKPAAAAKPAVAAKPAAVAKAAEPATMVTLPKGTAISAAARQTLATDKNKVGDTFAASLTAPIQIDGKTVIPKGAQVTCRIVKVKKHELKVTLASVIIHGKSYPLDSNSIAGPKSEAQNDAKNDAKATDKVKENKDATLLAAKSKLTFKLAKPVTIPVKG
jgi:glucose/arabinose dehydrogenase